MSQRREIDSMNTPDHRGTLSSTQCEMTESAIKTPTVLGTSRVNSATDGGNKHCSL